MVHCVVWTREQKKGSHCFSFLIFISCSSENGAGEDLEKYRLFVWRWANVWIVLNNLSFKISQNNHSRLIKHDWMSKKSIMFSTFFVERKVWMDSNLDSSEFKKNFEEKHVGKCKLETYIQIFHNRPKRHIKL